MALLPTGTFSLVAFVLIFAGIAITFRRGVPKAYALGLLMMAVFLLDEVAAIVGGVRTQAELGFQADRFFAGGAWWSPVTSIFSHAPPGGSRLLSLHVIGNLFILVTAGPALEERVGERKFLVIFFTAGLAALAVHSILAYTTDIVTPESLAIGASGAIFGVLTTFAVRYPRAPLPMLLLFMVVSLPAFVVLLIYLGFNVVYMVTDAILPTGQTVAWWGHFAGFLVGLPFAYTLAPMETGEIPRGAKGLPDPEKLAPLATTPETRALLEKVRQFKPEARTRDDANFALSWIDRFFEKATCPTCGARFTRRGLSATCASGETTVEFGRTS
jgi:membrane associated rhomboid family serine protease